MPRRGGQRQAAGEGHVRRHLGRRGLGAEDARDEALCICWRAEGVAAGQGCRQGGGGRQAKATRAAEEETAEVAEPGQEEQQEKEKRERG